MENPKDFNDDDDDDDEHHNLPKRNLKPYIPLFVVDRTATSTTVSPIASPIASPTTPIASPSPSPSQATQATQEETTITYTTAMSLNVNDRQGQGQQSQQRQTQSLARQLEPTRLAEIASSFNNNNNHNILRSTRSTSTTSTTSVNSLIVVIRRHLQDLLLQHNPIQQSPQQTIVVLASASTASMVLFIGLILPSTAAMGALVLLVMSSAATLYAIQHYVVHVWWQQTVVPNGLGQYLPESLRHLLTQESIHDFMTDDTFMLENRHLLLYFLPIPPPQRERFLQRLAPRHQQRLTRPGGLGHALLGPNLMQLLVGTHQQHEQQQQDEPLLQEDPQTTLQQQSSTSTPPPPQSVDIPMPTTATEQQQEQQRDNTTGIPATQDLQQQQPQQDPLIITSNNSLLVMTTEQTVVEQHVRPQPPEELVMNATPTQTKNDDVHAEKNANGSCADSTTSSLDENNSVIIQQRAEEYAAEELVLTQAMFSAVYDGVWTPVSRYLMTAVEETTGPVTARLVTYGLGISAVSTVLGLLLGMSGYRRGIYRRPTVVFQQHREQNAYYPRENTLYTTVLLGLAGTGITLLAHWQLSRRGQAGGRKFFYSQFQKNNRRQSKP